MEIIEKLDIPIWFPPDSLSERTKWVLPTSIDVLVHCCTLSLCYLGAETSSGRPTIDVLDIPLDIGGSFVLNIYLITALDAKDVPNGKG